VTPSCSRRWFRAAWLLGAGVVWSACATEPTVQRFREKHGEFAARATTNAPVTLIGTYVPESTIHKEAGEFALGQALLDATVPLPQTEDSFLVFGALAGVRRYRFTDVPLLADDDLHRYGLRLGLGHFVNDDLLLQGYWQPSIYSDLDGTLNSADYRLDYGTFLAVYRTSPDWFWKVGTIATDAVDTGILPLAGFTWHFADSWSLQTLLPRDLNLVYENDDWIGYLGFMLESDEYHVRSPTALGLADDVHVQELLMHLTIERRLGKGSSILVRGGTTVAGNYDYGYGNGTDDLTGTLEQDWFFAVGLAWRL
jgi:hypothetical protein